ncbi:hypothetical protein BJG93_27470 [Paraburkholderia sprentiae WSM5005]|uniref:Uncharacterized protein n=1 Tax=Paraburkholderia sprentiae WSM5005 TaxID=754502 RepID=A0A1I9YS35_9BURK|nr:hypothetical protein [Paraburkholderia sprentiae]APA89004.1 hypothetical protein BJG93_27470 [Paraburkholderia sprentiae WSM5005]
MNQRLSSFQVGPLPTFFYRDDGDLDVDLFGELWASAGLQNKQLKSLIRPEIFSSTDDAGRIRALAQLCEKGDWRKGWYQNADARKKGVPPSIQELAHRYAKQTLPALDMYGDGLGKFFKRAANGKIYPRLEKAGDLADFLGQCFQTHARATALFTWAVLEKSLLTKKGATALDADLRKLPDVLMEALHERGEVGLLDLLAPLETSASRPEDGVVTAEATRDKSDSLDEVKVKKKAPELQRTIDPLLVRVRDNLTATYDRATTEFEVRHRALVAMCSDLAGAENPVAITQRIRTKLDEFDRGVLTAADEIRHEASQIQSRLRRLSILQPTPAEWCDLPPAIGVANAAVIAARTCNELETLTGLDQRLVAIAPEVLSRFKGRIDAALLGNRASAVVQLQNVAEDLERFVETQEAREAALKYVGAVSQDADWMATDDPQMDAYWPTLATTSLADAPLLDSTWLICRRAFDLCYDEILQAVRHILVPLWHEDMVTVDRCLSLLDPNQLERLARDTPELERVIVLTQAYGFLAAARVGDDRKFDYWSTWPLSQYAKAPGEVDNPLLERLLGAVFSESSLDDGAGTLAELALIANEQLPTGDDGQDQEVTAAWAELDLLLQYRQHGMGHYASLWKAAHKDCIEPLQSMRVSSALAQTAREIQAFVEDIDVDSRYVQWLKISQAPVLSQSQYEATTKVYVEGRLEKVRAWCERYAHVSADQSSSRHSIRDMISMSDASPDRDVLVPWVRRVAAQLSGETSNAPMLRSDLQDRRFGIGLSASVEMPRSYLARLAGSPVRWGALVTDSLAKSAGACAPSALWNFYRAAGSLEAQEKLREASPEAVSEIDARLLEQELDLHSLKQAVKISDLKTRFASFRASAEVLHLQRKMGLFFGERQWTLCEATIAQATILADSLEQKAREDETRQSLGRDIQALGGIFDGSEGIDVLSKRLAEMVENSSSRRVHIRVLEQFARTKNLATSLFDAATTAVADLSVPQRLPDADGAAFLAEAWGAVLSPISEQLKRPQALLPGYKHLLEIFTASVVRAMGSERGSDGIDSKFLEACIDFAPLLDDAASPAGLRTLIEKFAAQASMASLAAELERTEYPTEDEAPLINNAEEPDYRGIGQALTEPEASGSDKTRIVQAAAWVRRHVPKTPSGETDFRTAMKNRLWAEALKASVHAIGDEFEIRLEESSRPRDALLTAIACAAHVPDAISEAEAAAALGLLAMCEESQPVQWLRSQKGRLGGSLVADFVGAILLRWAGKDAAELGSTRSDARGVVGSAIRELGDLRLGPNVPAREAFALFGSASAAGFPAELLVKALWESFTGDKQQAEVRAAFMQMLFKAGLYRHVGLCFTFAPIEMEKRVALAYAQLLQNSDSVQGRAALENIRSASQAKPFASFAQAVLGSVSRNQGLPAEITFAAPLEKAPNRRSWLGVLAITPRAINPPLDIEIELPGDGAISFAGGRRKIRIEGPFFEAREERVELVIDVPDIRSTIIRATCDFLTLEEKRVVAELELALEVAGLESFDSVSAEQVDAAFAGFPQFQMRGHDYVPRDDDERRIETTLFGRDRAGSVWLSSPRRSGKTTMLFRILDEYSHKVGRDNGIVFLSLDKGFQSVKDFNYWVWTRVQSNDENEELRSLISDFARIGERLPFDAGTDVFLTALSKEIISRASSLSRVFYLFDEVDKLAEMHLAEGQAKDVAIELSWQFRHIIASQTAIGMVFCGSNPARTIFVRNADAALYNSIANFELTPFGMNNDLEKRRTREIVEPGVLRGRYKFPEKTLAFLVKITAGIPYYMKLVAGATYATAQQTYLMQSDVINGLKALLEKSTGVTALDSLDDPGEDELRVLFSRKDRDQLLVRAVLYAAADIKSPVSAGPLMVGDLRSERSPLVSRYNLSRAEIAAGVESAIQLGYLKRLKDLAAVEFRIPMLGESIRVRSGALWAMINDKLEQLNAQ